MHLPCTAHPTPQNSSLLTSGSSLASSSTRRLGARAGLTPLPRSTSSGVFANIGSDDDHPPPSSFAMQTTASTIPPSRRDSATPVTIPVHCAPSIPTPLASITGLCSTPNRASSATPPTFPLFVGSSDHVASYVLLVRPCAPTSASSMRAMPSPRNAHASLTFAT